MNQALDGYVVRDADPQAASALGRALGLSATLGQALINRGLGDVEAARAFLDPRLSGLTPPVAMADRDAAAARIVRAVRARERIVVFGDYDVDGTTSAALLTHLLLTLGSDVVPVLASRFGGGYGLSDEALARCLAHQPTLIVTCDCGSSDHERLARARLKGVSCVVIDHHLVPDAELPVEAFLNPHRPGCGFAYKGLCSAGLAFSVAAAIRAELDPKLDLREYLDLVALGTIADVAPLDGDNRRLVRAGLARISQGACRPGIAALLEAAGSRSDVPVGARDVAFKLGPRLNAPGRLGDPTLSLELLLARDPSEARRLASRIELANQERRDVEARVTAAALAQVEAYAGPRPAHPVVAFGAGWHRGVVGIVASRLTERFRVPAIAISVEDGVGHGSARTFAGADVHALLGARRDLLLGFGGHAAAAGLTVAEARLSALRDALREVLPTPDERRALPVDLTLDGAFGVPRASELAQLEPVGAANAPIRVHAVAKVLSKRSVGQRGSLQLQLSLGSTTLRAFAGPSARVVGTARGEVELVGLLVPDSYRGEDAVQLEVEALA